MINFEDPAKLRNIFTEKRLALIEKIQEHSPDSIRDLARTIDRGLREVHEDLKLLEEYEIVQFVTDGRAKRPIVPYDRIDIKAGLLKHPGKISENTVNYSTNDIQELREISDDIDLTMEEQANAFYSALKELSEKITRRIFPVLRELEDLSDKQSVTGNILFRMIAWIRSLAKLDWVEDLQAAAAGTRSLFELYLDLYLITEDKSENWVERYLNYPDIKRYSSAKKVVNNIGEKNHDTPFFKQAKNLIDKHEEHEKVKNKFNKYWKKYSRKNDPKDLRHWSGIDSARSRAEKFLGDEGRKLYVETNDVLNMLIHSDPTGFSQLRGDNFHAAFGHCYSKSHDLFLKGLRRSSDVLKLKRNIQNLDDLFETFDQLPGQFILALKNQKKHRNE